MTQIFDDGMTGLLRGRNAPPSWAPDVEIRRVWDYADGVAGSSDVVSVSRDTFAQALTDSCSASSFVLEDVQKLASCLESLCELPPNFLDQEKICLAFSSNEPEALVADIGDPVDNPAFLAPSCLEGVVDQLWESITLEGCTGASAPGVPAHYFAVDGDAFNFALRLVRPHACGWQGGKSVLIAYTIVLQFASSSDAATQAEKSPAP